MISRRKFLAAAVTAALSGALIAPADAAEAYRFDWTAFDAARAAGGPVLVDVSAPWCSTCKAQRAVISNLVSQPKYAGYKIFVIDYDSEKDLMRQFGARQRSTLIAFKGEREVGRIVGDTREAAIEALLAKGL